MSCLRILGVWLINGIVSVSRDMRYAAVAAPAYRSYPATELCAGAVCEVSCMRV